MHSGFCNRKDIWDRSPKSTGNRRCRGSMDDNGLRSVGAAEERLGRVKMPGSMFVHGKSVKGLRELRAQS